MKAYEPEFEGGEDDELMEFNDDLDMDDELVEEVEITISPLKDEIEARGFTLDEFEQALEKALAKHEELAARDDIADDDIPPLNEIPVEIGGQTFPLGAMAMVEIVRVDEFEDEETD